MAEIYLKSLHMMNHTAPFTDFKLNEEIEKGYYRWLKVMLLSTHTMTTKQNHTLMSKILFIFKG